MPNWFTTTPNIYKQRKKTCITDSIIVVTTACRQRIFRSHLSLLTNDGIKLVNSAGLTIKILIMSLRH